MSLDKDLVARQITRDKAPGAGHLLPFSKRTARSDTPYELDVDDLEIVDDGAGVCPAPEESSPEDLAQTVRRRPPASVRRTWDEHAADDVADECLASIAAVASRPDLSSPGLPRSGRVPIASAHEPPPSSASRLPAVLPPPFLRTASRTTEVPWVREARESAPSQPVFVHRASVAGPPATPSASFASLPSLPSVSSVGALPQSGSVAPVALSSPHEPTVILVRERPRGAWIVGSALIGAAAAVLAMKLMPGPPPSVEGRTAAPPVKAAPAVEAAGANDPAPGAKVTSAPAPPAVEASASAPTPSPALAEESDQPAALVRFEEGVAIMATPPGASAEPRPAGPETTATREKPPVAPAPAPKAVVRPKAKTPAPRTQTPEQRLAEAQLKASMKK
jgi:hypothetical protein